VNDISSLLQQSGAGAWLFLPSALALGALHGLVPGHSNTVMAATLSHTAVVRAVAMGGRYFCQHWNAATSEPYLQLVPRVLITATALNYGMMVVHHSTRTLWS